MKGSRDRSSCRAAAVASTPGSRAQAATEGGFLGLRHKTKEADGGIAEKTSFRRKNIGRRMRSCTGGAAGQPV